jgi:S-(hydroxymethyl)glutathione dehydrogenase/alcohol dehydrogenase
MTAMTRTGARAAVLHDVGRLDLQTVYVDGPESREVRVRPVHVGVCHSDLHYFDGSHRTDLPEVLGHEVAGVVESVGSDVTTVRPGDRVVTSLTMFCGGCRQCVTGHISLCENRASLRQRSRPALVDDTGRAIGTMGGVGGFSELLLIHENGVVSVPESLPSPVAALFGCAVLTGIGAVTRSAQVSVGSTVAVVGCGGIGLAAVQGARIAGASRIIAIDLDEQKLAVAVELGATDAVRADGATATAVRNLVPGGVEYSFEAIGKRATAELAFALLAPGGVCTVLGMVPDETPIRVPPSDLYFQEKTLRGAFIGSSRFTVDVPQLVALHEQGRLDLDRMISHRLPLEEIVRAMDTLGSGKALRVVIDMPEHPGGGVGASESE